MSQPLLSIICPAHNAQHRVGALLAHVHEVLARHAEVEVIIIDDGSRDETPQILGQASQDACPERLKILLEPSNRGPSAARNRGIHAAQGRYVCFLDDDDTFELRSLATLVSQLAGLDADVITINMQEVCDGRHRVIQHPELPIGGGVGYLRHTLETQGNLITAVCAYAFRREFLARIGWSFPEGLLHEDCLSTPLALLQARSIWHHRPIMYRYQRRPDSITTSRTNTSQRASDLLTICEGLMRRGHRSDQATALALLAYQFQLMSQAWKLAGVDMPPAFRQRALSLRTALLRQHRRWVMLRWTPSALLRKRYLRRVRTCLIQVK